MALRTIQSICISAFLVLAFKHVKHQDKVKMIAIVRFSNTHDVLCFAITGKASISNDGATIMKLLDVVHPAAKTLVEIAKSQDAEVD